MFYMYNKKNRVIIAVITFLVISFFSYLMYGNLIDAMIMIFGNRGNISETYNSFSLLYSLISIIVSSVFSYLVYRMSVYSYEISKKMSELELEREKDFLNKDATIILTMITRNFNVIREMYKESLDSSQGYAIKKLVLSESWIENIANLMKGRQNVFNENELNQTCNIFEDFVKLNKLVKGIEDGVGSKIFTEELSLIMEKYFNKNIPVQLYSKIHTETISELLNIECFVLLRKLHYLATKSSQIEEKKSKKSCEIKILGRNFCESDNSSIFEGNIRLYDDYGYIKFKGSIVDNTIICKEYYGYSKKNQKLYEFVFDKNTLESQKQYIKKLKVYNNKPSEKLFLPYYFNYEIDEESRKTGIWTKYDKQNQLIFHGSMINKKKEGRCYFKYKQTVYKGWFKNNQIVEGELCKRFGEYEAGFIGEFYKGEPWNGELTNYSIYDELNDNIVYRFSGNIKGGMLCNGFGYTRLRVTDSYTQYEKEIQIMEENNLYDEERYQDDEYVATLWNEGIRNNNSAYADYIKNEWVKGEKRQLEEQEVNILVRTL